MPDYIKLCMNTWCVPYTLLDYDTVNDYTDLDIMGAARFTLPQTSDCIRAHVLRDHGGYWMDADTIMLTDRLPACNVVGDPVSRSHSIGLLYTEPKADMYVQWSAYQDRIIESGEVPAHWGALGNSFTNDYVKEHEEITIAQIAGFMPDIYMGKGTNRRERYIDFYFDQRLHLSDVRGDILMLHNSWTPQWYKELTAEEVLECDCTLSNILRERLCDI